MNDRKPWTPRPELPTFEPPGTHGPAPKQINTTRRVHDVLYVAGHGPRTSKIMFIMPGLTEDDARENIGTSNAQFQIALPARYMKSQAGGLFKNLLEEVGLPVNEQYFTAICKWLLPKARRGKPGAADYAWAEDALDAEIRDIKPEIIVCLGKPVFDHFVDLKLRLHEIEGGWFHSKKYDCRVYPMDDIHKPLQKPEFLERMRIDLIEVKKMLNLVNGFAAPKLETHYDVVRNVGDLHRLVAKLATENRTLLSVDCEWGGNHHVDGKLRSMQICWAPGEAAYIRFMDDAINYAFDVPYKAAGEILGGWLNQPQVKFIGHQLVADMAWMNYTLGLKIYQKGVWDTLYAMQCIDENCEAKLERLALAFTDLGRYDIDLVVWKKENRVQEDEGYARIPDDIIIPYACLRGHSLVQLGDGSWKPIRDLVAQRYSGTVKALLHGRVQDCRVTNWHRADVGQKDWFRVITQSTKKGRWGAAGPVFTPDHKIITRRGKVEVKDLLLGVDEIATPEREASSEQMSIVLASLIGDGGFTEKNANGTGFRLSQKIYRAAYADWKASSLSSLGKSTRCVSKNQVCHEFEFSRYFKHLKDLFPRHTAAEHRFRKLVITPDVLSRLGLLGLAVWYQDDGVYTADGQVRIICRKLKGSERQLVIDWLGSLVGSGVGYYESQGCLKLDVSASYRFLDLIAPFMHPAFTYKTNRTIAQEYQVNITGALFYEKIVALESVRNRPESGDGVRFCLSVEKAENFLTEVGFVSNCRDVDAVMRIYPQQLARMIAQGPQLLLYFTDLFLPFVTDIFASFTLVGLPMDMTRLDALREVFLIARDKLNVRFQKKIEEESRHLLIRDLSSVDPLGGIQTFQRIDAAFKVGDHDTAFKEFMDFVPVEKQQGFMPVYEHFITAPAFNIRSVDQMKRWLFQVKKFTPLKSTNNKEKGLPSMAWEKVLRLSDHARKDISPSTDKQTLKVLAEKDSLVNELLELNAVGNLTKAFLRPAEVDADGEVVRENGLHFWVASDGRIHGQFSSTETGRPRAWKPNSLNWPSWINNQIANAIQRVVQDEPEGSPFRIAYAKLMGDDLKSPPPSIRSCVSAQAIPLSPDEEGWCFVESDYKTAEVLGLACISGDKNLIRLMTEEDKQFASLKDDPESRVRLGYAEDYGVAPENQNPDFIMSIVKDGKVLRKVVSEDLLRNPDGALQHPLHDLHWQAAESTLHKPREILHKKKHRDGLGKVANFQTAYGASSDTLERLIEVSAGAKADPGTGEAILKALDIRQPVAQSFLKSLESVPDDARILKAASGRIRHFASHGRLSNVNKRIRDKVLSSLSREARNYLMQESVASTASRAALWLNAFYRRHNMRSRVCLLLYDSIVTLCPLSERFAASALHQLFMDEINSWVYHGRKMTYPIDTELNYRWSCRPSKAEQKQLNSESWNHNTELTARVLEEAKAIRAAGRYDFRD